MKSMKKTILVFAFAVATLSMISCKTETKVETETATETKTKMETTTAEVTYACPMDCEKGKTYTEKGKCPVCEMDLVASNDAATEIHDDHEGHNH